MANEVEDGKKMGEEFWEKKVIMECNGFIILLRSDGYGVLLKIVIRIKVLIKVDL